MLELQTLPLRRVSPARGSVQKNPAWWASHTADVMFNIDNSPERNGLWSFRKILCAFFFFFPFFKLSFLGPAPGLMPSISWIWWADILKALITSDEMNCLRKQSRAKRTRGEMCFTDTSFPTRDCLSGIWALKGRCFPFFIPSWNRRSQEERCSPNRYSIIIISL